VRILGIDPGSNATGYGVVSVEGGALRRLGGGTIRTRGDTLAERLGHLQRELERAIAALAPEVAALESRGGGSRSPSPLMASWLRSLQVMCHRKRLSL
jgi:crossover junction endodeoxyribonuclease RuvC